MFKAKGGGGQRLFKQLSEKLVADGIPYHDNDDGSGFKVNGVDHDYDNESEMMAMP